MSPYYDIELRLSFLKYISEIENSYTIILGDFNSAKVHQTKEYIEENHEFLIMVEENKYIDEVNNTHPDHESYESVFTDHSGIKVSF